MGSINIVKLLKECVVLSWRSLYLRWINWHLDKYIRVAKRNVYRYGKISKMIDRYNYIFDEDLLSDNSN